MHTWLAVFAIEAYWDILSFYFVKLQFELTPYVLDIKYTHIFKKYVVYRLNRGKRPKSLGYANRNFHSCLPLGSQVP
jgi:hypothetical protein